MAQAHNRAPLPYSGMKVSIFGHQLPGRGKKTMAVGQIGGGYWRAGIAHYGATKTLSIGGSSWRDDVFVEYTKYSEWEQATPGSLDPQRHPTKDARIRVSVINDDQQLQKTFALNEIKEIRFMGRDGDEGGPQSLDSNWGWLRCSGPRDPSKVSRGR